MHGQMRNNCTQGKRGEGGVEEREREKVNIHTLEKVEACIYVFIFLIQSPVVGLFVFLVFLLCFFFFFFFLGGGGGSFYCVFFSTLKIFFIFLKFFFIKVTRYL